jgi:Rieske Fe-S protein
MFRALGEWSMDVFDPDGHRYQVQAFSPQARKIIKPSVGKVTCGKAEDFEIGSVTPFNEGNFFLVRLREGFIALSRWCSHKNGQVRWEKEHWRFYCPLHGASYNRRGEFNGHIQNVGPLRMNPVTITGDGVVVVDTGVVIVRQDYRPDQVVSPVCGAEFCAADVERV